MTRRDDPTGLLALLRPDARGAEELASGALDQRDTPVGVDHGLAVSTILTAKIHAHWVSAPPGDRGL